MNKKWLMFVGAIIAVAMAITLYYVFMPSWVIAVSAGDDENAIASIENRFKITDDDLAEFPVLVKALAYADEDEKDPSVVMVQPVKAWYWEGMSIVERFDMDSSYPPEYKAVLIYEDSNVKKVYGVQVVFGYELARY